MDMLMLTLVVPCAIEESLFDALLELTPADTGFTTFHAEGHGRSLAQASASERVRGRRAQSLTVLILPAAAIDTLIAALQLRFAGSGLHWWTAPADATGRLA